MVQAVYLYVKYQRKTKTTMIFIPSDKRTGSLSKLILLCLIVHFILISPAWAHGKRENYVWVNIEQDHIAGRFEVNIKDLRSKLGLQIPSDVAGRDRVLQETAQEVQSYLLQNFSLSFTGQQGSIQFADVLPPEEAEGRWVKYLFRVEGVPQDDLMTVGNTIFLTPEFLKSDPLHKSLVLLDYNRFREIEFGDENTALVFGPHLSESQFSTIDTPKILIADDFLVQGLIHIWFGLDHMLFLFTLLLTSVLVRVQGLWQPVTSAKAALFNIVKIVTIFTISHSITLVFAVLGWIELPIGLVEAIIAGSIAVVAINNIFPVFSAHTWLLIFVFGLIHGLGFASAMGDLQFRNVKIEKVLFLFSLGIELGQIIVVVVVLPILYWLRNSPLYRQFIMPALSLACALIASWWFGQRVGWW